LDLIGAETEHYYQRREEGYQRGANPEPWWYKILAGAERLKFLLPILYSPFPGALGVICVVVDRRRVAIHEGPGIPHSHVSSVLRNFAVLQSRQSSCLRDVTFIRCACPATAIC
jgi:hypothetical protein